MTKDRLIAVATSVTFVIGFSFCSYKLFTQPGGLATLMMAIYNAAVAVGSFLYGLWAVFGTSFPDGKQPQGSMAGWSKITSPD